ncbi:MAG: hypothetical protein HOD63_12730 [Bacteroidetes bacterium]|nr:hypothetical protein [Bacteroidota bacterium]MBT5530979.1 hypothetical protein [Cytophagia bacterium]MBT3801730.1 hypothetical protein [Bacteroidota bacterium]MBT3933018.1 hypothetical protein [Bacteroidota bacterium]MBT4339451.1 hypothetical protein [Bacteroidota bacterium]
MCRRAYWESGDPDAPYFGKLLYNNTFDGDGGTPPCYTITPHDNYR